MMSTLLCSGNNNKTDRNHRSASSSSSSIIVDDAIGASSALNVSTPNACTGDCRLFQEIPEDLPDRRPLQDAEQLLAKDLNQVSHQERQDALHDIHGVSDLPDESPAFVARCQNDLELYLIRNQKRSAAFQTVWNTGAHHIDYIRSLYLLFLRCDAFDIAKAGQRIYLHFDTKLTLFGQDKLGRDITLNDFDAHDMDCYKAGFFQILPVRDRAGRAICIKLWKLQKFHCRENVVRIITTLPGIPTRIMLAVCLQNMGFECSLRIIILRLLSSPLKCLCSGVKCGTIIWLSSKMKRRNGEGWSKSFIT